MYEVARCPGSGLWLALLRTAALVLACITVWAFPAQVSGQQCGPTPGQFMNANLLSNSSFSSGAYSLTKTPSQIEVRESGSPIYTHPTPPDFISRFLFFGENTQYLLIADVKTTTFDVQYVLRLVNLANAGSPAVFVLLARTLSNTSGSPQLHVRPSQGNGQAVFVFLGTGSGQVLDLAIYCSQSGMLLCAANAFVTTQQVVGQATATTVQIKEGGTIISECALPIPEVDVSPSSLDFGTVTEGSTVQESLTVDNLGDLALDYSITSDNALFVVSSPAAGTVGAQSSVMKTITFAPPVGTTLGTQAGQLTIEHNDPGEPPQMVSVQGLVAPLVPAACLPASVSFGEVDTGTSDSVVITIENCGGASLDVQSISFNPPTPSVWSTSLAPPLSIGPGAEQMFTITLTVPGGLASDVNYATNLTITTNDPQMPIESVALSGTGHVPVGEACYEPSTLSMAFGVLSPGANSTQFLSVRNCGDAPLVLQSVSLSPSDPVAWSLSPPAVPPELSLPPGQSQSFGVTLAIPATLAGDVSYSAIIAITTDDPVSPSRTVSAQGTGHLPVPRIEVPPEYFDLQYGDLELGFRLKKTFVVRNLGDLTLSFDISHVDPADPDRADFALETDAGSFSIPPSGEIVFQQEFAPSTVGQKTLLLRLHNANDPLFSEQLVTLSGNATTPVPMDAVLVLDRSGSMAALAGETIKIEKLSRAASLFADYLRDGVDYLGLTRYNHHNNNIVDLDEVASVRDAIRETLSDYGIGGVLRPLGGTGIGGAMETASTQFGLSPTPVGAGPEHRKVLIVLTDGKENESPYIQDILDGYDGYPGIFAEHPDLRIYSVGLGPPGSINEAKLQEITNRGLGGFHLVTGELEDLSLFKLEEFYFKVFADGAGMEMVVDPTYRIRVGETLDVPINVSTADRELVVMFTGEFPSSAYVAQLVNPQGTAISSTGSIDGTPVQVRHSDAGSVFRVGFPDADGSYAGAWRFKVRLADMYGTVSQVIRTDIDTGASVAAVLVPLSPAGTHRVSVSAAVTSDYKIRPAVSVASVAVGTALQLRVAVTEAGWPAAGGRVTATITHPDGSLHSVELADDGTQGDGAAGDGIFGGSFDGTFTGGTYQVSYRSIGHTEAGNAVTRLATLSQYVGPPEDTRPIGRGGRALWYGILNGVSWPLGTTSNVYDPGLAFAGEAEYEINPNFRVGTQISFYGMDAEPATAVDNLEIASVSFLVRAVSNPGFMRPYLLAAVGAHHALGSWHQGYQVGAGLEVGGWSNLALVVGGAFHLVDPSSSDIRWIDAHIGFRVRQ